MKIEVRRFPDLEELNRDAAVLICDWAAECVRERGSFAVALSGGSTPRRLYERLTRPPCDVKVPWSHVHFFWGDERCGRSTHKDSNYNMAQESLLRKIAPPPENVHRPPSEVAPPERAADLMEGDLRSFFSGDRLHDGFPVFDLVLLGLGQDGHTASLFPGDGAVEERERWVAAVAKPSGTPPVPRLTLTLPVLNSARCVVFLVSGAGKREVVREVLSHPDTAGRRFPAALVRPPEGRLLWFLDGTFV